MIYSFEAEEFIKSLKEFSKADFEKWFKVNVVIGSNNLRQYLAEKKHWQNDCKCMYDFFEVPLSPQTEFLINSIKNKIDINDLRRWFINSVIIDVKNILEYLFCLEKSKQKIIQPKLEVLQNGTKL
jgi:hypothetical protein